MIKGCCDVCKTPEAQKTGPLVSSCSICALGAAGMAKLMVVLEMLWRSVGPNLLKSWFEFWC